MPPAPRTRATCQRCTIVPSSGSAGAASTAPSSPQYPPSRYDRPHSGQTNMPRMLARYPRGYSMTVPGSAESTDHWKSSITTVESNAWSLVSQIANRSLMISPPPTLPDVVSQPVQPPRRPEVPQMLSGMANPVPAISVASRQLVTSNGFGPEQPPLPFMHIVNRPVLLNARLMPTGV